MMSVVFLTIMSIQAGGLESTSEGCDSHTFQGLQRVICYRTESFKKSKTNHRWGDYGTFSYLLFITYRSRIGTS